MLYSTRVVMTTASLLALATMAPALAQDAPTPAERPAETRSEPMAEAPQALADLRAGRFSGAAVLWN